MRQKTKHEHSRLRLKLGDARTRLFLWRDAYLTNFGTTCFYFACTSTSFDKFPRFQPPCDFLLRIRRRNSRGNCHNKREAWNETPWKVGPVVPFRHPLDILFKNIDQYCEFKLKLYEYTKLFKHVVHLLLLRGGLVTINQNTMRY